MNKHERQLETDILAKPRANIMIVHRFK